MDALLVFPYFLVKLLTHLGAESGVAEWGGAVLSCVCLVAAMMAPFHPRDAYKTSMAGVSWLIVIMAATGCVWECREALNAAGSPMASESPLAFPQPRQMVILGEA